MQEDRVHPRLPGKMLVICRRSEGKLLPSLTRAGKHCAVSFTNAFVYRGRCDPRWRWHQAVHSAPELGPESRSPRNHHLWATCSQAPSLGCAMAMRWAAGYQSTNSGSPGPWSRTQDKHQHPEDRLQHWGLTGSCPNTFQQTVSGSLLIYSDVSLHL